jgi:fibronectin type 3 domain-containing protein
VRLCGHVLRRAVALVCATALLVAVVPGSAWALAPKTTLSLDPPSPGASGWYNVAPLVSVTSDQAGVLHWWWNVDVEATAAISAGVPFAIGVASEGEPIFHAYTVNGALEVESPGVNAPLKVDSSAPSQPGAFAADTKHNVGVALSWDASTDDVSGLDHYAIYRNQAGPPWSPTDFLASTDATAFLDIPPADGDYVYAVSAWDVAGNESALSELGVGWYDFAAPVAPAAIGASPVSPAYGVAVSWTHDGVDTTSYVIERSQDGGVFVPMQTVADGISSWNDPLLGVSPAEQWGSTWTYRVKATGPGGESEYATSVPLKLTSPPSAIGITQVSPAPTIGVSWTHKGVDVTGYVIERSRDGGAFALVRTETSGTVSWNDPLAGLSQAQQWGSTWSYRVKATGPGGESAYATSAPLRLTPSGTSISITSNAASVVLPRPFVLSGFLALGRIGDRCVVYVKKPGSRRWSYSSARLAYSAAPGGANWWYRYTPKLHGYYSFYVRFEGDPARVASQSRTIRVRVR